MPFNDSEYDSHTYHFQSEGTIIVEILCEEEHPVCAFPWGNEWVESPLGRGVPWWYVKILWVYVNEYSIHLEVASQQFLNKWKTTKSLPSSFLHSLFKSPMKFEQRCTL